MRQGFALVGIGLVAGVVLSLGVAKLLASQLVGVSPFDASTYGATIAMVAVTAALACALPGWRAMRLDPLVALRQD